MSTERGHFIPKFPAWKGHTSCKSFWEKFSDENKMEENPLFFHITPHLTLPWVAITSMKGKKCELLTATFNNSM